MYTYICNIQCKINQFYLYNIFFSKECTMYVKAKDTADICLFFDQIFDSVNGNFHKVVDGKVYRTAVTKNSPHH